LQSLSNRLEMNMSETSTRCKMHQVIVFDKTTGDVVEKTKYYTLSGLHGYLDAVEKSADFKSGKIDWESCTMEI